MKTPVFTPDAGTAFYNDVTARVKKVFQHQSKYAGAHFWIKAFAYATGLVASYYLLLHSTLPALFTIAYILVGLFVLLLVFNVAHDAAHQTISKHGLINRLCYTLTFPLLGNHPYVWRHFHLASHHIFTNVEGSDIDVVTNPLIRLNQSQPLKKFHRWQFLYAPCIYLLYTLHFVFIRDVIELSGGRARTIRIQLTIKQWALYIFSKTFYFTYALLIPYWATSFSFTQVLMAFLGMHACMSVIIVLVLACNHQVDLTDHIGETKNNQLPFSWATLQLRANLDYSPNSRFWHALVGGFNAHTVHHLFPAVNHTHYRKLIPIIRETAALHGLQYNETCWKNALRSHFRFLKKMGNNQAQPSIA